MICTNLLCTLFIYLIFLNRFTGKDIEIDNYFTIEFLDTKNDIQSNGNAKRKPKLISGLFM